MTRATVELPEKYHAMLQELAARRHASVQDVLGEALEEYRRKLFLEGLNEDFATLRSDPQAWKEELQERAETEGTLGDDLEAP